MSSDGSMVHVIAKITLRPGTRDRFLEHFTRLVPLVRAEDGCIEYGGAVDLATGLAVQQPLRDDVVIVVEKWSTLEALRAHLDAPHMIAYRSAVKDYVIATTLQVLRPVPAAGVA